VTAADSQRMFTDHSRDWKSNLYVYPVISRRSSGLSIGINLNPDKACNFDCIYCQVDRTVPSKVQKVDLETLGQELEHMISLAVAGTLYDDLHFGSVPSELRHLRDIAFSGDGEPTTCPQFLEVVERTVELKSKYSLDGAKIVLITDACYLDKPKVQQTLEIMDASDGEIWAKLDAGTEEYYQLVNRPNFPLSHVLDNILQTAKLRPIVIQALFMQVHNESPSPAEIEAFCERLNDIANQGGRIKLVQVYTIARNPAEHFAKRLTNDQVDTIAQAVRSRTDLSVETYYGPS